MINIIFYIILWLMIVYVAVIYNSVSMIFLAGIVLLLSLFLYAILIWQSIALKLSFKEKKEYQEQAEVKVPVLMMENASIFPVKQIRMKLKMQNLTTGEKKKVWQKTAVPVGKRELLPELPELSCGVWRISCTKVKIFDLFQRFFLWKWKSIEQELIRLPEKYQVDIKKGVLEYESAKEQEDYEPWKKGTDASHIREIREYQPGDSLRNIHWKLSAKKEELLVKEYGQPTGDWLVFGLDIKQRTELELELVYSLLYACTRKALKVLVIWQEAGKKQPSACEIQQEEDVYRAMEQLMRGDVVEWKPEEVWESEHQLWLREKKLYLDEMEIQDFSQGSLQEKLLDMELML